MSIIIIDEELAPGVQKTVEERTWRATQFTEKGDPNDGLGGAAGYTNTIFRERWTTVTGVSPSSTREPVAPVVGDPAEGTDGTLREHYEDATIGFIPEIEAKMAEVLQYPPTDTVTITPPGGVSPDDDVTVPAAIVPLLLQATYDLVSQKKHQEQLDAAIDAEIAEVQAILAQGSPVSPAP